jgi:hypothetical protein
MPKKNDAKDEEPVVEKPGLRIHGEVDGCQTPVGGEVDGVQSPDPVSDPSQKEIR